MVMNILSLWHKYVFVKKTSSARRLEIQLCPLLSYFQESFLGVGMDISWKFTIYVWRSVNVNQSMPRIAFTNKPNIERLACEDE